MGPGSSGRGPTATRPPIAASERDLPTEPNSTAVASGAGAPSRARARPAGCGADRRRANGGVAGGALQGGRAMSDLGGSFARRVYAVSCKGRSVCTGGQTLVIPVSPSANTSPETTCNSSSSPALRCQTASPFSTRRKSASKTMILANSSSDCCACRAGRNKSLITSVVRPRPGRSSRIPAAALAIVVSPRCA